MSIKENSTDSTDSEYLTNLTSLTVCSDKTKFASSVQDTDYDDEAEDWSDF